MGAAAADILVSILPWLVDGVRIRSLNDRMSEELAQVWGEFELGTWMSGEDQDDARCMEERKGGWGVGDTVARFLEGVLVAEIDSLVVALVWIRMGE
jgi:hypothetical protein